MRDLLPALVVLVLLIPGRSPALAGDDAAECDRLAGHPFDPARPAGVVGVPVDMLDGDRAVAACARALAQRPAEPRLQFELARGLYQAKRFAEAVDVLRRSAEQGYAAAQRNLGDLYYRGKLLPQDDGAAFTWFRRAAEQGHALAQLDLGKMYERGHGTVRDPAQAAYWYRQSAERLFPRAQHALAYLYQEGNGVPKDRVEALKWFAIADSLGDDYSGKIRRLAALGMPPGDVIKAYRMARRWLQAHRN